jgi:hypothetical protein
LLEEKAECCRKDIGDAYTGVPGQNCRLPGKVESAVTLTSYDKNNPYFYAIYDLDI